MNWHGKNVLVTGAAGFIGSHLTEELMRQGAYVRAMVHYNSRNDWGNLDWYKINPAEVIAGDIRDPFFMRKAVKGMDYVFHLAALIAIPFSYLAPSEYVETNVKGTLNVMQACLDEGVKKVVHTSTSEVYGTAKYTPIDEEHPLQGQSPYSASKIGADKIVESYHKSFGLPVVTLRPFNTYGPRQSARAVIPTIITQMIAHPKEVRLGSTNPKRDFTYVGDTVAAFLAVAGSKQTVGQTLNCGSGHSVSIAKVVSMLSKISKTEINVVPDELRARPEKSEVFELMCNHKRITKMTGWEPTIDLEFGLRKTFSHITLNDSRYKSNIYNV